MARPLLPLLLLLSTIAPTRAEEANKLRLPSGFKIALYADETLANDIQAMTLDRHGRVVVTGPGYVKTLHTDPKTGRASHATVFAIPKSGGQGLCFVGDDLLITADHWLSSYRDSDHDGRADGRPEPILPLATAEHGGHAIRQGPDGFLYVIGGNDAGIDARHITTENSPVVLPEAGGIVRLSSDFKTSEVIAHGFRNPYDFDFNSRGDLLTYDSDCERDEFLPWSTPTRVFHVAIGGHHGWRLRGYLRSFARRPDLYDTIGPLVDIGRGSPTGVVCYRHTQFPDHYRDGLFLLDWTFGRIHFVPRESLGASTELFLEPIGSDGFAPTDICVAPDGSLFVSIGGRKTRGAVYRIWHEESASQGASDERKERPELDRVLEAPQPLDAWSRDTWEPIARKLGQEPFVQALADVKRTEFQRIRAVEVLAELFNGPSVTDAERIWPIASDPLKARIAWALSRRKGPLERPARIGDASESLAVDVELLGLTASKRAIEDPSLLERSLSIDSPRIIPAAERVVRPWTPSERDRLARRMSNATFWTRLNFALVNFRVEESRNNSDFAIHSAQSVLDELDRMEKSPFKPIGSAQILFGDGPAKIRRAAIRLMIVALGDWDLDQADADVFTPYTLPGVLSGRNDQVRDLLSTVRKLIPSGSVRLDEETKRLLAMLHDPDPVSRRAVVASFSGKSTAAQDLHSLIVYDCLTSATAQGDAPVVAEALCQLDHKLGGKAGRIKQTWNLRVGELFASLSRKHPDLIDALIARNDFAETSHIDWAVRVDPGSRVKVARAFYTASLSERGRQLTVNDTLLDLFDALPRDEVLATVRARSSWTDSSVGVLTRLAKTPIEADRPRFLANLGSRDVNAAAASLKGLENLPPGRDPRDLLAAFAMLRRLLPDPSMGPLRQRVATLIARQLGESPIDPEPADASSLAHHYARLFLKFNATYPDLGRENPLPQEPDPTALTTMLSRIDWNQGSLERGAELFRTYQCASCHSGAALGPDLAGVGRRLSRENLFTAINDPGRDVAPAYRPTALETKDGRTYTGFIIFESAEGLILQTGPTTLERIASDNVETRRVGEGSLMPNGLLREAKDRDYADIYAYLKSL